ncbi:hypothetical protein [Reyranella massiliensis]|uniref:hypothetical protein n=1 Tax=Reyranella massiliensis TaxID=445220 RepID=UPI0003178921|nr:hypothetical protein [Reyranella massiliensis]
MYAGAPYGTLPFGATPPFIAAPPVGAPAPAWGIYGTSPHGTSAYGTAPPDVPVAIPPAEGALFLSSIDIDQAQIAGSSEVSSLPVTFVQDSRVEKKWRLTSKVDQYLSIALARPCACDTVAVIGANLGAGAVFRILGALDPAGLPNTPDFDSGWLGAWPVSGKPILKEPWPVHTNLVRFPNVNAYGYWRIIFCDPGVETSYMEFGRVLIGKAFRPRLNVDINPAIGLESSDVRRRSTFNRTFTDPRGAPSRRMALSLSDVDQDDMRAELFELQRYCGLARDFVFSLDPAATTFHHLYTMQSLFVEGAQFEAIPFWDGSRQLWRTSLQLTEPL